MAAQCVPGVERAERAAGRKGTKQEDGRRDMGLEAGNSRKSEAIGGGAGKEGLG